MVIINKLVIKKMVIKKTSEVYFNKTIFEYLYIQNKLCQYIKNVEIQIVSRLHIITFIFF